MEIYQRFKVPEYWIVDPANGSIEVYERVGDLPFGLQMCIF